MKAEAALKGMKMKDFIALVLEHGIRGEHSATVAKGAIGRKLPVMIPAVGRRIPALTNAQIFEILDNEDDQTHGRFS